MPAEVLPRLFCIIDLKKKEHHEHQAYPKLEIQINFVIIERYTAKRVDGNADDEK